jgi:hypothetical protein
MNRLRSIDSLITGLVFWTYGDKKLANVHFYIFKFRLFVGRFPTNREIQDNDSRFLR